MASNHKKQQICKHDWDYCGSFRICRKCFKVEDVFSDTILNYEVSGEALEWHVNKGKHMRGELNRDDT
jgi:hypothetical protein